MSDAMLGNDDGLSKKIENWLKGQGYPWEMEVAREFEEADFGVSLSSSYVDFELGKSREIDVIATRSIDTHQVSVQVARCVECKVSRDAPWLLFAFQGRPRVLLPISNFIGSEICMRFLQTILWHSNEEMEKVLDLPIFNPDPLGHGITEAFHDKRDTTYEAVLSAIKASIARAIEIDQSPEIHDEKYRCGIFFPIVALDGRLFECSLSQDAGVSIKEVEMGILHWKGIHSSYASPYVYIVTKRALKEFVKQVSDAANRVFSLCQENADKLAEIAVEGN